MRVSENEARACEKAREARAGRGECAGRVQCTDRPAGPPIQQWCCAGARKHTRAYHREAHCGRGHRVPTPSWQPGGWVPVRQHRYLLEKCSTSMTKTQLPGG
jgi:hypothetical protein